MELKDSVDVDSPLALLEGIHYMELKVVAVRRVV